MAKTRPVKHWKSDRLGYLMSKSDDGVWAEILFPDECKRYWRRATAFVDIDEFEHRTLWLRLQRNTANDASARNVERSQ